MDDIYRTPGNLFRIVNKYSSFHLSIGMVDKHTYLKIIYDPETFIYGFSSPPGVAFPIHKNNVSNYEYIGTGDLIEHLNKI